MGKEKADKYIRDLAAQKPILVESLLPAAERVATGETPIAITYVKYVQIFGQRGAPSKKFAEKKKEYQQIFLR